MKFIVPLDKLEKNLNSLKKFNSFQEKNALFVDDYEPLTELVKNLTNIVPSCEREAEVMLLKLREISVSDIIEVMATCPHCGVMNDFQIEISDLINMNYSYFDGEIIPLGFFNSVDDIINNTEAENLSLAKYNELENILSEQNDNILQDVKRTCRICKKEMSIEIDARDNFSKSSAASILQEYIDISIYSNNGKLDIDSLYPFEREIFISLIKEKLNKEE